VPWTALEQVFHVEGPGRQPDLDWTSIGLLAEHEVLTRATTDELFAFHSDKEGLLRVRLKEPRTRMNVTLLEYHKEDEVTRVTPRGALVRARVRGTFLNAGPRHRAYTELRIASTH
jgi:hypothetical protein